MVLDFLLIFVNLDVARLHPSPCVPRSVCCYNMPSYLHLAVRKMVNDAFSVTSKSQHAFPLNPALSFLHAQAKLGVRSRTGSGLGFMCYQNLKC